MLCVREPRHYSNTNVAAVLLRNFRATVRTFGGTWKPSVNSLLPSTLANAYTLKGYLGMYLHGVHLGDQASNHLRRPHVLLRADDAGRTHVDAPTATVAPRL